MTITFTNLTALRVQSRLSKSSADWARASERLSSGQRINRSADDAAGLAIAAQLGTNVRIYSQSLRNLNDGISALAIADGATGELSDVLTRLKELATQAINGTLSAAQRDSLDGEGQQLRLEFNRIVDSTQFNGLALLQRQLGTLRIQAGSTSYTGGILINPSDLGTSIQGDGTFATVQDVTSSLSNASAVAEADFDGDGDLDYVTSSFGGSNGEIFLNNGDGTFSSGGLIAPTASGGTERYIVSGDFNGDGKADIAYAQNILGAGVRIQFGNGDGTFGSAIDTTLLGSNNPRGLAVADINGDGKDDIVATEIGGFTRILTSNGDGTFQTTSLSAPVGVRGVAIGDFNGDGRKDIIVGGTVGALRLYLQDANGGYTTTAINGTFGAGSVTSIRAGDFNNDGVTDFAVGAGTNVYVGNYSGGALSQLSVTSAGTTVNNLRVGDLNGDGILDIVVARNNTGSVGNIGILTNGGNGSSFTLGAAGSTAYSAQDLILADLNLDGANDIVTVSSSTSANTVLKGNGNRTALLDLFSLSSRLDASMALLIFQRALNNLLDGRGRIGAQQSRLNAALNVISAAREGAQIAGSRITDADVAAEQSNFVVADIRKNIAASLLAQANQQPRLALDLLKASGTK